MKLEHKKKLDYLFKGFLIFTSLVSIFVTLAIVIALIEDTIRFFTHQEAGGFPTSLIRFFTEREWTPTFEIKEIGIWPFFVALSHCLHCYGNFRSPWLSYCCLSK